MFANEVMHPDTHSLMAVLKLCKRGSDETGAIFYEPLSEWDDLTGRGDEAKADLYALIAENCNVSMGENAMASKLSWCLHINSKRYPRG